MGDPVCRRCAVLVVMAAASCGYPSLPPLSLGSDDPGLDAAVGGAGDASGTIIDADAGSPTGMSPPGDGGPPADACVSFSAQFDTCVLSTTTDVRIAAANSGTALYNTDSHQLVMDGVSTPVSHMVLMTKAGLVDAILAHDLVVSDSVHLGAMGSLPFAIVASGSISLEHAAMINVAAGGAGALSVCGSPAKSGANRQGGGGGGGGGGYGAMGGNGGTGNKDGGSAGGGAGGTGSGSIALPAGPTGGCAGGKGGDGDTTVATGGAGGLGGGAIYLVAAGAIHLADGAVLTASGGGGKGGVSAALRGDGGGGGGGSGGMIWLEAPHVISSSQSQIAANGGGGGEGSNSSTAGANGRDGGTTAAAAPGGDGDVPNGSDGGAGGAADIPAGVSVTELEDAGGGGAGGGVGYIRVVSPDFQPGSVSPAPAN